MSKINYYLLAYLFSIGIVSIVLYDFDFSSRFTKIISDEGQLELHFQYAHNYTEEIVLINSMDFPVDTIQQWAKRILKFKPKVLAFDLFYDSLLNREDSFGEAKIVLPIIFDDGKIKYSINQFTLQQEYGSVEIYSKIRFKKFYDYEGKEYPSFALQVVRQFDESIYDNIKNSKENTSLINYVDNFLIYDFLGNFHDDWLETHLKNKIVLVGYLGQTGYHRPNKFGDVDVHSTPLGEIYGTKIIASEIHTLLGNPINELDKIITFFIALLFLIGSFILMNYIKIRNRIVLILLGNLVIAVLVFGYIFLSFWTLTEHKFFISNELISMATFFGVQSGIIFRLSKSPLPQRVS